MLYPLKHEMVCRFIRGLALPLCLAPKHMIASGSSFSRVVDYATFTVRACMDNYRGGSKRPYYPYRVISIPSKSKDSRGEGQLYSQPINFSLVTCQTIGGSHISRGDHSGQSSHRTLRSN